MNISSGVTTTGVKVPVQSKEAQVKCDSKAHSTHRTTVGKLLWMSQLIDNIKHPVKESSINVVKSSRIKHCKFGASSQVCQQHEHHGSLSSGSRCSGLIPDHFVIFSASDWAGCQKSRRSRSGILLTIFGISVSSTSRTQPSRSHSSAEAEVSVMTQATVESLAMEH